MRTTSRNTYYEPCLVLSSSLRSFLYHLDTSQASIVSITISDKVDSLLSQHEPNTYQSRSTINYSNHTKQNTLIKQLAQSTTRSTKQLARPPLINKHHLYTGIWPARHSEHPQRVIWYDLETIFQHTGFDSRRRHCFRATALSLPAPLSIPLLTHAFEP